jgi:hypothetical protein
MLAIEFRDPEVIAGPHPASCPPQDPAGEAAWPLRVHFLLH